MDSINKQVKLGVFRSDDLESILSAHNSTELKELTLSYPFPVSLLAAKDWLNSRLEASTNFPIQINLFYFVFLILIVLQELIDLQ